MRRLRPDPSTLALVLTLALGAAAAGPVLAIARARAAAPAPDAAAGFARPAGWTGELRSAAALGAESVDGLVWALAGLAAVVLASAAVNVSTLLAARAAARRHETAVRAALGASPARVGAAALRGSAGIAAAGGVLAVALGSAAGAYGLRAWPGAEALASGARLAAWTAAAAGALAALVLLAALLPAIDAARRGLYRPLAAGTRATAGPGEALLRRALVVAQFAGSATLLAAAVLLARGAAPGAVPAAPGLDPRDTLVLRVRLPDAAPEARAAMEQRLLDAAAAVPGVRGVAASQPGAWLGVGPEDRVRTLCDRCVWGNMFAPVLVGTVRHHAVSPGAFAALGVPLVAGREPAPDEARAVLVNRVFAATLLPRANPVGQRVTFGGWLEDPYTIVGVVEDVRAPGPGTGGAPPPTLYLAGAAGRTPEIALAARVEGDAGRLAGPLAAAVARAVPGARVGSATTLEAAMRRHAAPLRWFAAALLLLAGAATLGAAGGLYGVMSFTVARRTRELGVRAALGAAPGRLLREVLGEGARLAGAGAVAGGIGAATVARLLQERFQGVDPLDGATYLLVAAALAAVTLAASAAPALRAARLDAAEALRAE